MAFRYAVSASLFPASSCSIRHFTLAAIISFAVCRGCGCLGVSLMGVTLLWVFMGVSSLGLWSGGLCRARMMFRVVPIEYRGDVGGGDVFKLIAEKFHGDVPQNLSAGGARHSERMAAKAQLCEVYGVLAEDVVAHPHVG